MLPSPGRATGRQIDAIVALEHPQRALIIGLPGTGKTQVIIRAGTEIGDWGDTDQHQALISSFQHDAVENALERTDVHGLPPVKVGERRRRDGIDPIERWCESVSKVSAIVEILATSRRHVPLAQPYTAL